MTRRVSLLYSSCTHMRADISNPRLFPANPLSREPDRIVKLDARKDKMRSVIERGVPIYILVSNGISRWYRAESSRLSTPLQRVKNKYTRRAVAAKRFLNSASFLRRALAKECFLSRIAACFDPTIYHYTSVHGSLRPAWTQFAPPWQINVHGDATILDDSNIPVIATQ